MECGLDKGELLRLQGGARGVRLYCLQGTVWLTKGDGADYLVHQGQCFHLVSGASALVEALGSAEVRLEAVPAEGAEARPVLIMEGNWAGTGA